MRKHDSHLDRYWPEDSTPHHIGPVFSHFLQILKKNLLILLYSNSVKN